MFNQIRAAIQEGQKTVLTNMLEDVERMRSGDLRRAWRQGDKLVKNVVEQAAQYIGVAVANLANLLNPEVVVLGGGVIEALAEAMLEMIRQTALARIMPSALPPLQIVASTLGDHAGIVGAAVLARQRIHAST
jgi:glucokinase